MKQNPFSLYDFLGYFVPGALVLYLYFIIEQFKKSNKFVLLDALENANNPNIESILPFVIISYVLGHFLSYISSITIEQYANWKYDYPSKYLLALPARHFWNGLHSFHCYFWRIVLIIFLAPMVVFDFVVGQILGFKKFYHKKLDSNLAKLITIKLKTLVRKLEPNEQNIFDVGNGKNQDFHRIIYHYVYENSKCHQSKLNNYVALYGFLRTLTLVMIILFWYIILHTSFFSNFNWISVILITVLAAVIYVFFMGFMKFYRRFTLEGLMVLAISKIE